MLKGSSFKFYSPDRKPTFSADKIFVAIIAGNNEKVKLKAKFGEPDISKKITKESMDQYKKKKDVTFNIQNISNEQLHSILNEIRRRRKEEQMKFGIGNHIEKNKFVQRFSADKKSSDIMLRGVRREFFFLYLF